MSIAFFMHGGEYEHIDRVRPTQCSTCAFRKRAPTVRPAGFSLDELVEEAGMFDTFVCHQAHEGEHLTCRAWAKLYGQIAL